LEDRAELAQLVVRFVKAPCGHVERGKRFDEDRRHAPDELITIDRLRRQLLNDVPVHGEEHERPDRGVERLTADVVRLLKRILGTGGQVRLQRRPVTINQCRWIGHSGVSLGGCE
jgi:hypothetical protein